MNFRPPISSLDFDLPFDSAKFNEDDFENLCAELFEEEFGIRFHRYGTKGNSQFGIDLLSDKGKDGFYIAVQCKHVKEFSSCHVDEELIKFKGNPLPIKEIYFSATCKISTATVNYCHEQAQIISEPLKTIQTWAHNYNCRMLKKYPNIIGTYFGLQWRDYLFPKLNEHNERQRAEKLTDKLNESKRKYNLLSTIFTEKDQIYSGASIELKPILEGYYKGKDDSTNFHGDLPSNRGFCLKYAVSFDLNDNNTAQTMFSMLLTPEDAIDLEAVLLMDMKEQASRSTYYSHDILLTHIQGPTPMISILSKDLSFMFAKNSDYQTLLKYVENYLDEYEDIALSARRYRALQAIEKDIPNLNSWLV
ncbi:MAG TPA: hypothetical protein DEO86_22815 [Colwellia sp.]|nr:hypothetical protein [Colwellia sp.]|tara:strand:+ start:2786 stop:3871 length:1086 start_codon:yes stop_codon:yes gene_type:complete